MAEKTDTKKTDEKDSEVEKVEEVTTEPTKEVKATAKAGKRSQKSVKEQEEKEAKVERKKQTDDTDEKPKPKVTQKPPRSKIERKGKKYQEVYKLIDHTKVYSLEDSLDLAIKTNPAKFDATAEMHFKLGVDPKQADQNVRDTVVLPSGTGKAVRIAVFAEGKDLEAAKKAGADIAQGEEFLEQLNKENINFDILIATPLLMPKLSKYARLLGPKGLMPNPKNGTVSSDPATAVKDAKGGKVEYKIDSSGIVHIAIGKLSFGKEKLLANAQAVSESIKSNKPATIKANYLLSIYISSSMGPSIQVDKSSL